MKRILIALVICLSFWNLSFSYQVVAETNFTGEEKHTGFYDALLVLLDPYARKAINTKYPSRSYGMECRNIRSESKNWGIFSI